MPLMLDKVLVDLVQTLSVVPESARNKLLDKHNLQHKYN